MHRPLLALLLVFPVLFGSACGGGGGGSDPAPPCTLPGTTLALAIQGQPAPDTGGNFGPLASGMLMDAGEGGWVVFVAPTTDGTNALCLFVAEPDGTVRRVFGTGEVVPNAGGGTISGFLVARVNAAGQILTEVSIAGDSGARTFGLLTAQVVGGVVTAKTDVVYHLDDVSASGVSGALTDIDETRITFLDDGRTTFGGTTNDPAEAVWIVNLDGSGLKSLIATGDALPDLPGPSVTCQDVRAFGVCKNGAGFAFVADVGGVFEDRLYVGPTSSSLIYEVASDGNALPGGGTVLEIYGGGPLLVFNNSVVLWKAVGNGLVPDDVILAGSSAEPYIELARSGDLAGGASGGFFGELDLLAHRGECQIPEIKAELFNVPGGADFATYVVGRGAPLQAGVGGGAPPPHVGPVAPLSAFVEKEKASKDCVREPTVKSYGFH